MRNSSAFSKWKRHTHLDSAMKIHQLFTVAPKPKRVREAFIDSGFVEAMRLIPKRAERDRLNESLRDRQHHRRVEFVDRLKTKSRSLIAELYIDNMSKRPSLS